MGHLTMEVHSADFNLERSICSAFSKAVPQGKRRLHRESARLDSTNRRKIPF